MTTTLTTFNYVKLHLNQAEVKALSVAPPRFVMRVACQVVFMNALLALEFYLTPESSMILQFECALQ